VADQRNVVLVAGTGTGMSHVAVAIVRTPIRNGARGRFFNVVNLVHRLETGPAPAARVKSARELHQNPSRRKRGLLYS
jgi:DNA replication protein DnaC